MLDDILEISYTTEELEQRIKELGEQISRDYKGEELLIIGVLKGAFMFMAQLCKHISVPAELVFVTASSYRGTMSSGKVQANLAALPPLKGRHVLIVEDIIDSGLTLQVLTDLLKSQDAASVEICTMLDKPARRVNGLKCRYVGFAIEDNFVVGYGLDYNEKYRNLPFIGILKPEIYEQ